MSKRGSAIVLRALEQLRAEIEVLTEHVRSSSDEEFMLLGGSGSSSSELPLQSKESLSKNEERLALHAQIILDHRRKRLAHIPKCLFGEPGWEMLLDLFIQTHKKRQVSVSSLCNASDAPDTTALRHLSLLEQNGLVSRFPSQHDKRVVYVRFTPEGYARVGTYLADACQMSSFEAARVEGS